MPETGSRLKISAIHFASFLSAFLPQIALKYFGCTRTILYVGMMDYLTLTVKLNIFYKIIILQNYHMDGQL